MTNQNRSEDTFEKMLEQGASDPKAKQNVTPTQPPLQQMQNMPKQASKSTTGIKELTSLGDPDAWIKDLYGLPQSNPSDKVHVSDGTQKLRSLADSVTWTNDLLGLKQHDTEAGRKALMEKEQKKSEKNHTPLDMSKVYGPGEKHPTTPEQSKFFKKYQQEYEQFLQEKKRKEENEKRKIEEEEKKKREEAEKRKKEEESQVGGGQGKQKQKLGQPRRKATTELHPETKMGGAK